MDYRPPARLTKQKTPSPRRGSAFDYLMVPSGSSSDDLQQSRAPCNITSRFYRKPRLSAIRPKELYCFPDLRRGKRKKRRVPTYNRLQIPLGTPRLKSQGYSSGFKEHPVVPQTRNASLTTLPAASGPDSRRSIAATPPVTRRPPHRSRRADFPHRALQRLSLPHQESTRRPLGA
jgi:hypothetical protein